VDGGPLRLCENSAASMGGRKLLYRPGNPIGCQTVMARLDRAISGSGGSAVARGSAGGLIISGRTGGREIAVETPKSEISALLAGSRWPVDVRPPRSDGDEPPSGQMSLF
jgi:hypothetical protein